MVDSGASSGSGDAEFKISTAQSYNNVIADNRIAEFWGSNGISLNNGDPRFWKSDSWGIYSGSSKSKYVLLAQPKTMLNNDDYPKLIAYVDSMPSTNDTPHYYIYGDFDGDNTWEEHELTKTSGTNYSTDINIAAAQTRNFKIKIKYGDFTKYYGMNSTITGDTSSWSLYNDNGNNASITSVEAGNYTFSFDSSKMTYNEFPIAVSYPAASTVTTTIYVNSNSGATNIYLFSEDGTSTLDGHSDWPGDLIGNTTETIGGVEYKKFTFDSTESKFQFIVNKGSGKPQTNDSGAKDTGKTYYVNWDGKSGEFDFDEVAPVVDTDNYTITFKNEAKWDTVKVYLYGDGGGKNGDWPGQIITTYGVQDQGAGVQT